jgi:hypothetical protein
VPRNKEKERRLPRAVIEADRQFLRMLQTLPDYQPLNPAYSIEALLELEAKLTEAEQREERARVALAAARLQVIAASGKLRASTDNAKDQVIAQHGIDSDAARLVSAHRRGIRQRRNGTA